MCFSWQQRTCQSPLVLCGSCWNDRIVDCVRAHCCSAVWNLVSRVWLSDHFPVVSFSSWMSHDAWFCYTVILVMSSVLQFCLLIFSTFSSFSLFCFFLPLSALCDGACYERLLFFFTAGISFTSCLSVFPLIVLTCVNHALSVRVCPCSSRLTKLLYFSLLTFVVCDFVELFHNVFYWAILYYRLSLPL